MKQFNKQTLQVLRDRLNDVLKDFDPDLQIELGKIVFTEAECDLKVKIRIKDAIGTEKTGLGLIMKQYNLNMVSRDLKLKLVDYRPRSYKYPVIYQDVNTGERFKTSIERAKYLFAA